MSDYDDDEEGGFLRRNRIVIIVAVVGLIGAGVAWKMHTPSSTHAAPDRIVMVAIPPPPPKPIPTPPPVQQPPPEQKVTEQKQVLEPDKTEAPKPEPSKPDEPPPSMGSNIKGAPDGFGLSGSGNGGRVGIGGNGTGSGSPYAGYARQIQNRITEVLRRDKRTRAAAYRAKVKLWLDSNGTVTRAEPTEGNDAGAAAALVGVKMLDGLPQGMPMPVKTQINSVRP